MEMMTEVSNLLKLNETLNMFMAVGDSAGVTFENGKRIEHKYVNISPRFCSEILANHNTLNRKLNPIGVKLLTKEMNENKWVLNGDTIVFNEEGILANGQHRLNAIIKSGKTVKLLVVTGVNVKAFESIDIGYARSGSDILSIYDIERPTLTSAIVKFIYAFENGKYSANRNTVRNLNNQEIFPYFNSLVNLEESIDFAKDMSKRGQSLVSPSTIGGLHYFMNHIDPDLADNFIEKMCVGSDIDEKSPIFALRKKLISAKTNPKYKLTNKSMLENIVHTWNIVRGGKKAPKTIKVPAKFKMELK